MTYPEIVQIANAAYAAALAYGPEAASAAYTATIQGWWRMEQEA